MSEKLALLSISPVQSYIFKSRKAVDLFNGSKIISDLIIFIIKTINASNNKNSNKVKFIYPQIQYILNTDNLDGNENEINVSNKIIFRFNGAETEAQISKLIEELINKFVEEKVKKQLKKENKELEKHEEYKEKIKEFFKENFKIIILIKNVDFKQQKDKSDNFLNVLKKLYRDLESQKHYFDFENNIKALDIDPKHENCTLCGIRAGKILNTELCKKKIDDKESLCYPCYFKRYYLSKNYISTMDVAFLPYYFKFKGEKDFETYLKNENGVLTEKFNKCRASIFYFDDTKEITEELEKLYKKNSKPSNYFAIIKADIDDLGKHLSGEFLEDGQTSFLESYQEKLSCGINKIGKNLKKELIRDYFNKEKIDLSIYMGGDDYLFFIEIDKIMDMLEKLDKKIDKLNEELGYNLNDKKKITLSKSIVISNYRVPFNKVLRLLSNGLDKAKNKDKEKNGICYTLIDSLSRTRQAVFKNDKKALKNLDEIKLYFKNDLSKSVIYDLERILKPLGSYYNFDEFIETKNIIDYEIKRIIKRKLSKKENVESIYKNMIYLLSLFVYSENTDYFIDLNSYFEMLKILAKLSTEEV